MRAKAPQSEELKAGSRTTGPPRKSFSMEALRLTGPVPLHRKRSVDKQDDESEPLVVHDTSIDHDESIGEENIPEEIVNKEEKSRRRKEYKSEYKKQFRPFNQYEYIEGRFQKKREAESVNIPIAVPEDGQSNTWYREVLELRKKAGEYKHRGWGTELVPEHIAELYSKQITLWEQVSRRSSLSALSLASTTPRPITKEGKDKENSKKSSPSRLLTSHQKFNTAHEKSIDYEKKKGEKIDDNLKKDMRSRKEYLMRHHLERTTGSVDGALLPSPTREKLEPVMLRQRDDGLQKSPKKGSPKRSLRPGRSHSAGPGTALERSPKKQPLRTSSAVPIHKPFMSDKVQSERRPRPSGEDDGTDDDDKGKDYPDASAKEEIEPILVKSPPEPTRVKSPEQLLMQSPEAVNWTVPLDTGKAFTVTQNIREGVKSVCCGLLWRR